MEAIEKVANISVGRACGFGSLAIICLMVGFSYEPPLAARIGGVFSFVMTLVLMAKAALAPRKPYRHTETWLMLGDGERPPAAMAQAVIGQALRRAFLRHAGYSSLVAVVLLAAGIVLGAVAA